MIHGKNSVTTASINLASTWFAEIPFFVLFLHVYIPSFMKIGTGIPAILRFCFRNLRGCDVGIPGGRDLRCSPLKWTLEA
jgi:hypothetical protein